MSTKKRLWMSVLSLALVVIVAGASVGITLAALQGRVGSGFDITYVAKNVIAEVSGSYTNSDGSQKGSLGENLNFAESDPTGDQKKFTAPVNVTLNSGDDFLEFQYTIHNKGQNGFGVSLNLEMTGTETINFKVVYSTSYRANAEAEAVYDYSQDTTAFAPAYVTKEGSSKCFLDIGVKITLVDILKSAQAEGKFTFTLDGLAEEPFEIGGTSTLLPGREFATLFNDSVVGGGGGAINFGNLTARDQYDVDGVNKIASPLSVTPASLDGRTKIYEVENEYGGSNFYVLAPPECKIFLNQDSSYLFSNSPASEINGLTLLDTSLCTNMSGMFSNFNEETNLWYGSSHSSLDLTDWDTSHVTDMSLMFFMQESLNSIEGLDTWNTSSVTKMDGMFAGCTNLDSLSGIINWDVSHVTTFSRYFEGSGMPVFGGPFTVGMFSNCTSLRFLDLSEWNTSSATDMRGMFKSCPNLGAITVGTGWDLSNVTEENSVDMFGNTGFLYFQGHDLVNLQGMEGTTWSADNPTDKTYARVDEAESSGTLGYLWRYF